MGGKHDPVTMAIPEYDVIKLRIVSNERAGARNGGANFHSSNTREFPMHSNEFHKECSHKDQDSPSQQGDPTSEEISFVCSPAVRSIRAEDHQVLLECFRQGENPSQTCLNTGHTLMHVVVRLCSPNSERRMVPMVYQLSNVGAEVNGVDRSGVTPVQLAISRRLVQVLAALLKCGAEVSPDNEYHVAQIKGVVRTEMYDVIRRLSPSYWSAVLHTTPFKVNRLARSWSRINIVNQHGLTLIEFAKQSAQVLPESVSELIHHEASVELAHAVMAGDADRARWLLCDSAADIHTCDTSVKDTFFEPYTPLTLVGAAVKLGHMEVLGLVKETLRQRKITGGNKKRSVGNQTDCINSTILSTNKTDRAKLTLESTRRAGCIEDNVPSSMCHIF